MGDGTSDILVNGKRYTPLFIDCSKEFYGFYEASCTSTANPCTYTLYENSTCNAGETVGLTYNEEYVCDECWLEDVELLPIGPHNLNTGIVMQQPFSPNGLSKLGHDDYAPWVDLINFKPSAHVMEIANETNFWIILQELEMAIGGELNLDYYSVDIAKLPTGYNEALLFEHIRTKFGNFKLNGGSNFMEYSPEDKIKWESSNPLGAVMRFEVEGIKYLYDLEEMAVVTSKVEENYWIFSPVHTLQDKDHPLAGNRQFGLSTRTDTDGSKMHTFYTRGIDRPWGVIDAIASSKIFRGADLLWKAVMKNVVQFINSNGGKASLGAKTNKRIDYNIIEE